MGSRKKGRKKPYPHNLDIEEAIKEVLAKKPHIHPLDFPDEVRKKLQEKGFHTGLVSGKRIWKIYEEMVRKGRIYDVLGVVIPKSTEFNYIDLTDEEGDLNNI